jgi:hypothetical protein
MTLCLSAPSKTFLAGEYAVLMGAPALVLCTKPRFELRVKEGTGCTKGIPSGSPAAGWLDQRRPLLQGYDLEFVDPHGARGGFGASGAQFLLCHAFTTFLQGGFSQLMAGVNRADVCDDLNVLSRASGSGADVLSQSAGRVARVLVATRQAHSFNWPYADIDFAIVRTNEKTITHEHLANLDRSRLAELVPPAIAVTESFGSATSEVFLQSLKGFARGLRHLNLQSESCLKMLSVLEAQDWCLVAKGCGALGADTILFFYRNKDQNRVNEFLKDQRWVREAGVADLSAGLRIEWSEDGKS